MKWRAPVLTAVPNKFVDALGVSPFVGEILFRRGITTIDQAKAFLYVSHYSPAPGVELPGLKVGAEIIQSAIDNGKRIGVWGDFDVDGQTATSLLVSAFQQLGAKVGFHIPIRESESHGINIPNLKKMIESGTDLLVTCDTGISEHESIQFAKDMGIEVVITDHHDLPDHLPPADSVINPKMLSKNHPLRTLPGVGVAFKLVEHLLMMNQLEGLADQYLDLVALGIVADIARLSGDTRYLLQRGLSSLQRTDRLGLKILFENAELIPDIISEDDIGFAIAPRLNSLGRLGDANNAVEFLTTTNESRARVIAAQLEGLNAERKLLTSQVFHAADEKIARDNFHEASPAIVVCGEKWPGGVLGIVASRLVDRYKKPAIVLSTQDGENYSGSARSVDGVDISQAISDCSEYLNKFGGHPMAAGLSMSQENLMAFKSRLFEAVLGQLLGEIRPLPKEYDREVHLSEITWDLANEINLLSPFGIGNPPVVLAIKNIKIVSHTFVGRGQEHLKLIIQDENENRETVFWWGGAGNEIPRSNCNLVFLLKESNFQGSKELQLEVVDFWLDAQPVVETISPEIDVIDWRNHGDDSIFNILDGRESETEFVWSEIVTPKGFNSTGRSGVKAVDVLVVYSLPPSQEIFKEVLEIANPKKVIFIGHDPGIDSVRSFLRRLGGLCKYAIQTRGGLIALGNLAEAMAHTKAAVKAGLQWYHARGELFFNIQDSSTVQIESFTVDKRVEVELLVRVEKELQTHLAESKSYRKFLSSLSSENLEAYIVGLVHEI